MAPVPRQISTFSRRITPRRTLAFLPALSVRGDVPTVRRRRLRRPAENRPVGRKVGELTERAAPTQMQVAILIDVTGSERRSRISTIARSLRLERRGAHHPLV